MNVFLLKHNTTLKLKFQLMLQSTSDSVSLYPKGRTKAHAEFIKSKAIIYYIIFKALTHFEVTKGSRVGN